MVKFVDVLKVDALEESKGTTVYIKGRGIALYKYEGEFWALDNKCIHRGGQLGDGWMEDCNVICPLHGWDYDVKTGVSRYNPKDRVATYPTRVEGDNVQIDADAVPAQPHNQNEYLWQYVRRDDDVEHHLHDLHGMARGHKEEIEPMRTTRAVPNFDDIYFLPGQLAVLPLLDDEVVDTSVIIGGRAEKPLRLRAPIYISHMSFGALSVEAKMALAKGASDFGTVMCSGEGGMNPKSRALASQYIFEMASGYFGWTEDNIRKADAIEIKIGQSAKTGLGGLLPAAKVTEEIAAVRGLERGQDAKSPSRFPDINSLADMRQRIADIRAINPGIPIGIKFAASRLEKDLAAACELDVDFITIDGRPGGTGAAPVHVKDHIGLPTVYALPRARKWLDDHGVTDVTLCVTGGFRTSADVAKALAMGADAVAIATAAMMAIGCQQYRACNSNNCPVGIATQRMELRQRFDYNISAKRLVNFLEAMTEQMTDFARMCGKNRLADLSVKDLATTSHDIALYTSISHV